MEGTSAARSSGSWSTSSPCPCPPIARVCAGWSSTTFSVLCFLFCPLAMAEVSTSFSSLSPPVRKRAFCHDYANVASHLAAAVPGCAAGAHHGCWADRDPSRAPAQVHRQGACGPVCVCGSVFLCVRVSVWGMWPCLGCRAMPWPERATWRVLNGRAKRCAPSSV